jgi:alkylation response protein AidB-like acyl-CoA dehydrogenase
MQQPSSALADLESSTHRYFASRGTKAPAGGSVDNANASWREFAELGWLGAAAPEQLGGYGGPEEMVVLAHAIGSALAPEPYVEASAVTMSFLARAGALSQQNGQFERAMAGETVICTVLGCAGVFPGGEISFARTPDGIRLSGTADHVLGADSADQLLLSASDPGGQRVVLLIDCAVPGLRKERAPTIDGRHATFLAFDNVMIPASCEFADQVVALPAMDFAADAGLVAQAAEMVGVMDRAFGLTRDYLQTRRQFGQPLASFQVLRHRLADMYAELEQARAVLSAGVVALSSGSATERARVASGCKARAIKAARYVGAQSIQMHGAIGLTEQYDVGRCFKRLLVLEKTWGDLVFHVRRYAASGVPSNG